MSAASNYTEQNIINSLLRGVPFPVPANTFIALHTANPTDTGQNEVTTAAWPNYKRVRAEEAGQGAGGGWTAPVDGETKNTRMITFNSMDGASDVTVTHFSVWDAQTNGNMLVHAAIQSPRTLKNGDIFVFDTNQMTVTAS